MRVRADRGVCVGAGLCVLRLPGMFDQNDDDGTVVLLQADPDPGQEATVLKAIAACPSGALRADR
ncbi:ferredoxin [Micromonospora sp. NPDC051925]|uniref:ferredoxin n=1 Tax=Micromonospora sp. NPDC051925 TaxID=3364288 RepID=UPI0037CA929A